MDIENNQEYSAEPMEEAYEQQEQQVHYSALSEWFILGLWLFLCLEGMSRSYIDPIINGRTSWWSTLTPYMLYPSELVFYGPILLISLLVVIRGRRWGYKTSRGIWLLVPLWILGGLQAMHGKYAGAPGNAWLADLRQMILMSIFVPMFCVLAPKVRMWKLVERFYRIGVILALYNGTMGLLILIGLLDRSSEYAPFFAGDYVLIMMFIFVLIRSIILNKKSLLSLGILTYGIVTPLNKPALAVFVFAIFVVFSAIWLFRKRFETVVYKKAVKVLFALMVLFAVYALWLSTVGGGAAKQWLAERFLKTKVAGFERDISAGRFAAYQWGIDQWKQHPVFGTGFGINVVHFTKENKIATMPVHSLPITILYQTGLTGFLLCFVIFLIWLRRIYTYFQECTDVMEMWPLLGMFAWSMSIVLSTLLGQTLAVNNIGFLFWMCVAFLSNAETQNYRSRIEEDMSQQDVYEERLSVA